MNIWTLLLVLAPWGCTCTQPYNSSCLAEHSKKQSEEEHDSHVLLQHLARVDKQISASLNSTPGDDHRNLAALVFEDGGLINTDLVDRPKQFPPENYTYDMYAVMIAALLTGVIVSIYNMAGRELTAFGQPLAKEGSLRQDLLDNAKFLCVALVIFGHTAVSRPGFGTPGFGLGRHFPGMLRPYIWTSIASVHTKVLCFASGILSRGELKTDKVLVFLVGPILGYSLVIKPFGDLCHQHPIASPVYNLFRSGSMLHWYLFGLLWWRSIGALLSRFRALPRIISAFLIASMVYYVQSEFLSLHTLQWLPIFVAGQLFPYQEAVSRCPWKPATALLGLAMLTTIAVARLSSESLQIPTSTFNALIFQNKVFDPRMYPLTWTRVVAWNLLSIFKSIVFVILICPRTKTPLTEAGRYSICPYLLHLFLLSLLGKVSSKMPLFQGTGLMAWVGSSALALADFLICVGLCYLLTTWPVRTLFRPLLEPIWLRRFFVAQHKQQAEAH
mmetsp:Transcript_148916/g.263230  ORF Transcript_148916/g.263230 Transcript_148916/m.263230 type:complete len:500 (+) Transcript_148916:100-1599(+)